MLVNHDHPKLYPAYEAKFSKYLEHSGRYAER
jgi:hypothetical protein